MTVHVVSDLDVKNKNVLMRVDFNVPLKNDKVADDNRIVGALPTIKYVIDHGGKAILFSHLGRVKTEDDKPPLTLRPVADKLSELLGKPVLFMPTTEGPELEEAIARMHDGQVLLLQNTRYEDVINGKPVKRESGNDTKLAQYWSSLGDMFVNDAFGTAHRSHASNVGIAEAMKKEGKPVVSGFLLEKEIKFLGQVLADPKHPFVAILGGAKVSDKIGVINNLLKKADKILIGGGMTYTFYAAKGIPTGNSLVEESKIPEAKEILEKGGDKIVLPVDSVIGDKLSSGAKVKTVKGGIPKGWMGLDIGPETVKMYEDILKSAKTVVWNGPMGVFENPKFAAGTMDIAKFLGTLKDCTTIVGGGDSTAAVKKAQVADKLSHISTGGGASLEYMEGKTLPGIAALDDDKK